MKNKKPIRILQCVSNMDRAGIETMLMNYYRNIDRNLIQFDFLCNKQKIGDYDQEIKKLGGRVYYSPGLNPLKWFKYQKFMKNLFKKHPEYKIIHCQNEAMGFPALYAAKKANIPVRISHSHNTVTRFDKKWPIKILYKYFLRTVATDYVACGKAAGKYLFGKEVNVIPNAIDTKKFIYNENLRNKLRNKMNLDGKYVIGHVGRFEPQKNHEFLIDVFNEYQKQNNDAILLLIGTGTLEEQIKEKVARLGLKEKVVFTGNIPNVNEMYQVMDIFVLPSFHEGLPVVGVEAQAAGLKCLFSNKVTNEIAITELCEFLSISSKNNWIECLKDGKNYIRKNNSHVLKEKKYDVFSGTKYLQSFYLNKTEGLYENKT